MIRIAENADFNWIIRIAGRYVRFKTLHSRLECKSKTSHRRCRENIAETLLEKSSEMKSEVLRCLLVLPNVIQFFYARWMGKGDSFQLELENSMDTGIKEIGLLLEQEETEAA